MSERLTYGSYLKVEELLALQTPLSQPAHHDELLFIIIHQVYELWFKQLLHELDHFIVACDADDLIRMGKIFRRVHAIQRVLGEQVDILETMTPQEFNRFRDHLNPASGFQSQQFRELEFLCGLRDERLFEHLVLTPEQRERLMLRMRAPSLPEHLAKFLTRAGFPCGSHDETLASYRKIYNDERTYDALYLLLEDCIEFDERLLLWRGRHVRMVERMIGHKRGTGGSSGVGYLQTTLEKRIFPELWEVRTYLGSETYG